MKISSGSTVGATLREARVAMSMSPRDLADLLRISYWQLNRIETGATGFDTDLIERMPRPIREAVKAHLADEVNSIREERPPGKPLVRRS